MTGEREGGGRGEGEGRGGEGKERGGEERRGQEREEEGGRGEERQRKGKMREVLADNLKFHSHFLNSKVLIIQYTSHQILAAF